MIKLNNLKHQYSNNHVKVNIDLSRFQDQFMDAQVTLDTLVLIDTEPYVRYDTGLLNQSVYGNTVIGDGRIVYDVPTGYAYDTYHNERNRVTKDTHPNATPYWFKYSKQVNQDKWIEEVKKEAGGNK